MYGKHVQIFLEIMRYNGILCVMGSKSLIVIVTFRNQNLVLERHIFQFLNHVFSSYFLYLKQLTFDKLFNYLSK